MRVASIQMEVTEGDKEGNIKKAEKLIDEVEAVDLILLPEVWSIGYFSFDKYLKQSETLEGETITRMRRKAKEVNAYILAGSIVERRDDGFYNTSVLIGPGGKILATYRKMHLFSYGSEEARLLRPGREIVAFKTPQATLGLTICYDLRFPELYRRLIQKGVEVFLVSSAWPLSPRMEHWIMLNRVRAMENQSYLISCNCVGRTMTGKRYLGHSMFVDPWGTTIAGTGFEESILQGEINVETVHRARERFPALKDRVLR